MARMHLVELEDQAWLPEPVRDGGTAYLRFASELAGQASFLTDKVAELLQRSGQKEILDLCSGGTGPLPAILAELSERGIDARARLTDFFPNLPAFEEARRGSDGRIGFESEPVDATAVPSRLSGARTLFNAFHHFRPEQARQILAAAVEARAPIGVFELVGRSPVMMFSLLFVPIVVLFAMPFAKPFRWSHLLLTYLIPVIPFLVLWDGMVSCLRVYSESELRGLVAELGPNDYEWEIGRIKQAPLPVYATYLIGTPRVEA